MIKERIWVWNVAVLGKMTGVTVVGVREAQWAVIAVSDGW